MKKHNTMSPGYFICENLTWAVIAMIWYKNILFRCLGTNSYSKSMIILCLSVVIGCIVGIMLEIKAGRNEWNTFCNLITGYGLYTILTYWETGKQVIIATVIITVLLSILFAALVMLRKIKNNNAKKVICRRVQFSIHIMRRFLALGMTFIIVLFGVRSILGVNALTGSVPPSTNESTNEQTITNNIDTVLLLQDELWDTLSANQKLDVLQTIANIERRYLGIPSELWVGVAELKEGTAANYNDSTHGIMINMDSLLNDSSWELLDSVCHEAYHAYEHRLCDVYESLREEDKQLRIFRQSGIYSNEFCNYENGEKDFYKYYNQKCEEDARSYAEDAVNDYYSRIEKYLLEND